MQITKTMIDYEQNLFFLSWQKKNHRWLEMSKWCLDVVIIILYRISPGGENQ